MMFYEINVYSLEKLLKKLIFNILLLNFISLSQNLQVMF